MKKKNYGRFVAELANNQLSEDKVKTLIVETFSTEKIYGNAVELQTGLEKKFLGIVDSILSLNDEIKDKNNYLLACKNLLPLVEEGIKLDHLSSASTEWAASSELVEKNQQFIILLNATVDLIAIDMQIRYDGVE